MYLVNDVDFVFAYLWRDAYLFYQLADVVHRVVGSGIQFVYVVRTVFVEGRAGFTFVACFSVGSQMQAIDGFGKNPGASGLAYSARSAEQIGMGQFAGDDGIFQRGGQGSLPHY